MCQENYERPIAQSRKGLSMGYILPTRNLCIIAHWARKKEACKENLRGSSSAQVSSLCGYFQRPRPLYSSTAASVIGQCGHSFIGVCGVWGRAAGRLHNLG